MKEKEIINKYLEEQLRKADLEIDHYEFAVKHDQERLSYFINIKQHLESSIKNIEWETDKELRQNIENQLENGIPLPEDIMPEISLEDLYLSKESVE